jgi:hypothetical protein
MTLAAFLSGHDRGTKTRGGPQEKMPFFQIASGQILIAQSTQIALNMIPVKFG